MSEPNPLFDPENGIVEALGGDDEDFDIDWWQEFYRIRNEQDWWKDSKDGSE